MALGCNTRHFILWNRKHSFYWIIITHRFVHWFTDNCGVGFRGYWDKEMWIYSKNCKEPLKAPCCIVLCSFQGPRGPPGERGIKVSLYQCQSKPHDSFTIDLNKLSIIKGEVLIYNTIHFLSNSVKFFWHFSSCLSSECGQQKKERKINSGVLA